ncbi:MAG TPA: RidA family protein [Caldilineaceae bacterium]|nr:RidA family protein [Caldilineaceae bacterium]
MERRKVNPWTWQDQFGFAQGTEIRGGQSVLYCAGQASTDGDGATVHAGDMAGQINQAFDNLETTLNEAGYTLANVVRLNYYTTDVDLLLENWGVLAGRLAAAGVQPSSTLLGVTRLAFPDWLLEIEATAVK